MTCIYIHNMANKHMNIYSYLSVSVSLSPTHSLPLSLSLSVSLSLFIYSNISIFSHIYIYKYVTLQYVVFDIDCVIPLTTDRDPKTPDLPTRHPSPTKKKTQIPSPSRGRKIGNNCCRVVAPVSHTFTCVRVRSCLCMIYYFLVFVNIERTN